MTGSNVASSRKISERLATGGMSGVIARSVVAPLDRVKILLQTGPVTGKGGLDLPAVVRGISDEGLFRGFWKGNATNCIRVFPHTAVQFSVFETCKNLDLTGHRVADRLIPGAVAGASAATITQPLDVVRVRLQTQRLIGGFCDAAKHVYAEAGVRSFYKGYGATLVSICPYISINFATFESMKNSYLFGKGTVANLMMGGASGLFAQTVCFPLDTVRRRMQVSGRVYSSVGHAVRTIYRKEGVFGFYRGLTVNAMKVVPNNALRFAAFGLLNDMYQA